MNEYIVFFLRKDLELFGKFATKPTIPNMRIVKQMLANLVPKAFPTFSEMKWSLSIIYTNTEQRNVSLYSHHVDEYKLY